MELSEIQEIILRLKAVRNSDPDEYSIKNMMQALRERKADVSETTLRRIFAEHSETEDSFSYKSIKPVAELLIKEEPEQATSTQHIAVAHVSDYLVIVWATKRGTELSLFLSFYRIFRITLLYMRSFIIFS